MMLRSIINIVFGFFELLIVLRILLKVVGASLTSDFAVWIYNTTNPFIRPFAGIVDPIDFGGGRILEISAVIAIIIIGLINYFIIVLLNSIARESPAEEVV